MAFMSTKIRSASPNWESGDFIVRLGGVESRVDELAMLWVLNLSDGKHSLLDIAERSGCAFDTIKESADLLLQHQLLKYAS